MQTQTRGLSRPINHPLDSNINLSVSQTHLGQQHLHLWICAQRRVLLTHYHKAHGPPACVCVCVQPIHHRRLGCRHACQRPLWCICAHARTKRSSHMGSVIITTVTETQSSHCSLVTNNKATERAGEWIWGLRSDVWVWKRVWCADACTETSLIKSNREHLCDGWLLFA